MPVDKSGDAQALCCFTCSTSCCRAALFGALITSLSSHSLCTHPGTRECHWHWLRSATSRRLSRSHRRSYFGTMPWLAIPFGSKHRAIMPRLLGVQALPTLLIFHEKDKV
jgi:hypothetical protein